MASEVVSRTFSLSFSVTTLVDFYETTAAFDRTILNLPGPNMGNDLNRFHENYCTFNFLGPLTTVQPLISWGSWGPDTVC